MRRVLMAVVVAAGVVAAPSDARERLALRVSPAVALAPADLLIRADVAADAANRRIEVVAESDAYYRSSEVQLDGARAPRVTTITFRGLAGGAYAVRATLKGQDGHILFHTHTTVTVVDADVSP